MGAVSISAFPFPETNNKILAFLPVNWRQNFILGNTHLSCRSTGCGKEKRIRAQDTLIVKERKLK